MKTGQDLISALQETQDNLIAYQQELQDQASELMAEGKAQDAYAVQSWADQVNIEETRVARALLQTSADDVQAALAASDAGNLEAVVGEISDETRELNADEATLTWVLGLISGVTTVLFSVGTGGVGSALAALAKILASKP